MANYTVVKVYKDANNYIEPACINLGDITGKSTNDMHAVSSVAYYGGTLMHYGSDDPLDLGGYGFEEPINRYDFSGNDKSLYQSPHLRDGFTLLEWITRFDSYLTIQGFVGGNAQFDFRVSFIDSPIVQACPCFPAVAKINGEEYFGFYVYQDSSYFGHFEAWDFITSKELSDLFIGGIDYLQPGDEGFQPTNDINDGKSIGGRGKGSDGGHSKRPDYKSDIINQPNLPDESHASVCGAGFINVYEVESSDLTELGKALFGQTMAGFFVNTAVNPLDYIVSLNIFPYFPKSKASATAIQLGRYTCTAGVLDYSANGHPLTKQYNNVDFGTLQIGENWGSYLDYMTKVELYLPFIGTVNIDASEIMDGSINVEYIIDFFTGSCVANVLCTKALTVPSGNGSRVHTQYSHHSFQGNCAVQIPVTSTSYGSMIGSLIKATTTFISSGGSPVGLAMAGASLVGETFSGNMTAQGSSKGNITANGGYCSILYPYVRLTRPIVNIPESYQTAVGFPSYVDSTLASCTGLCVCDTINLSGISRATENELQRIEQMCKEGIYI